METKELTRGNHCILTQITEGEVVLYAVQEYGYDVSEVFEERQQALNYFTHTERYEAAQARKGRR